MSISAEDKEDLRYLKEVEWPKAYREQDTVLLDRILADEFQSSNIFIRRDGLWKAVASHVSGVK